MPRQDPSTSVSRYVRPGRGRESKRGARKGRRKRIARSHCCSFRTDKAPQDPGPIWGRETTARHREVSSPQSCRQDRGQAWRRRCYRQRLRVESARSIAWRLRPRHRRMRSEHPHSHPEQRGKRQRCDRRVPSGHARGFACGNPQARWAPPARQPRYLRPEQGWRGWGRRRLLTAQHARLAQGERQPQEF